MTWEGVGDKCLRVLLQATKLLLSFQSAGGKSVVIIMCPFQLVKGLHIFGEEKKITLSFEQWF